MRGRDSVCSGHHQGRIDEVEIRDDVDVRDRVNVARDRTEREVVEVEQPVKVRHRVEVAGPERLDGAVVVVGVATERACQDSRDTGELVEALDDVERDHRTAAYDRDRGRICRVHVQAGYGLAGRLEEIQRAADGRTDRGN